MQEIYDEVEEQQHDGSLTKQDFIDLAKSYLSLFFKNKVDENGFEVEPEELLTERNISLVLNLSVCNGMSIIYDALRSSYGKETQKRKGKIPGDIQFVLEIFNECSRMSVPKNFATGLVAVYVETYRGCQLDI